MWPENRLPLGGATYCSMPLTYTQPGWGGPRGVPSVGESVILPGHWERLKKQGLQPRACLEEKGKGGTQSRGLVSANNKTGSNNHTHKAAIVTID